MDSLTNGLPAAQVQSATDEPQPPVYRLPDEELAKIFSYLQPLERLSTAHVCRKWARASALLWTDIETLDLAPIPDEKIGVLVRLCPNLRSMVASFQSVPLDDLNASMHDSLVALTLFTVNLAIEDTNTDLFDRSLLTHFQRSPKLERFIWHNVSAMNLNGNRIIFARGFTLPINECGSLTKVHLTSGKLPLNALQLFDSLRRMPHLRCLTLGNGLYIRETSFADTLDGFRQTLRAISALRELCLINIRLYRSVVAPDITARDEFGWAVLCGCFDFLHRLEVFVLVETRTFWFASILGVMPKWIEQHPNLRLLVIDVKSCWQHHGDDKYDLNGLRMMPPRRRYPKGFGSDPLPYLNIFLGGDMASNLAFSQSTNAKIWPISERLPEFLAKPEIAEITGGVWALDVVKDAAKRLIDIWLYTKSTRDTVHFLD